MPTEYELTEADYAAFWKSHEMCVALATGCLDFLRGRIDYDELQFGVAHIYRYFDLPAIPDLPAKTKPTLRLVKQ
jgi:hypothetical protein